MNIIKDFRNDLLKRREVKIIISSDKNPGLEDATKIIANEMKAKTDLIVVKTLKSKFGRNTFLIDAFIYDTLNDKNMIEMKPKVRVVKA